jgi:uncharacterized protein YgiM (DUF1202 family)
MMKRTVVLAFLVGLLFLLGVSMTSAQNNCVGLSNVATSDPLNCKLVSGKGIGMSNRFEDAIILAVDILKASPDNVVGVCLKGEGGILYSRGSMVPRMAFWAWYYRTSDGFTCTNVSEPGVVVLVSIPSPLAPGQAPDGSVTVTTGDTAAATTSDGAPATPTPVSVGGVVQLENCTVVTRAILNFRDAPSIDSNVKDLIPYRSILKAIGKQGTWYNVIFGSDNGWVAASLVNTRGAC